MTGRSQQLSLNLGSKRDIAAYAISLAAAGSAISLPEVSRKLRFTSAVVIVSLVITISLFGIIRLAPDLGEAAPFVVLVWLAFAALFVYSLTAFTVLVITALTVQHVRVAEGQNDICAIGEDIEALRALLIEIRRRDPRLVDDVAANQGSRAQEILRTLTAQ